MTSRKILLAKVLPEEQLREVHPIKQRLREYKIKQVDLSNALNCSEAELSKWLNNKITMPWHIEHRLYDLFEKLDAEMEVNNDE